MSQVRFSRRLIALALLAGLVAPGCSGQGGRDDSGGPGDAGSADGLPGTTDVTDGPTGGDQPAGPDAPRCGGETTTVGSTDVVPGVLLVLDQSGSMSERDFGGQQRLEALQQAASALVNSPQLVGALRWGFTAFPSPGPLRTCVASCAAQDENACGDVCATTTDPSGCALQCQACNQDCAHTYPTSGCEVWSGMPEVPLGDGNTAEVLDRIAAMGPGGETPTDGVMKAVLEYLPQQTSTDHPAFVVLGTDGAPRCPTSTPEGALRDTFNAVSQLEAQGVLTFVIGLAQGPGSPGHEALQQIALAGGAARDGDTGYYPAGDPDALVADLADISSHIAAGCRLRLDRPLPAGRAVFVSIGGTEVASDPSDGFTYEVDALGRAFVILNGPACNQRRGGDVVQVEFGCPPQG
jgi:hypothetical protein